MLVALAVCAWALLAVGAPSNAFAADPVCALTSITVAEDGFFGPAPAGCTDTDNDIDPGGYGLTVPPSHGVFGGNYLAFSYMPDPNYHGPDSLTFVVTDDDGFGNPRTTSFVVPITVTPVNDAPTCATPITVNIVEDGSISSPGPCSDLDGDPISITVQTPPAHGVFRDVGGGVVSYVPAQDYAGPDTVVAVASDGTATSSPTAFDITMSPVDDAPRCVVTRALTTDIGVASTIAIGCQEVDQGDAIAYVAGNSVAAHGSVVVDRTTGVATYTPAAGYVGTDSFSVLANGSGGLGRLVTVQVTVVQPGGTTFAVVAPNRAPVCFEAAFVASSDTSTTLQLACSDPDGSAVTYRVPARSPHGVLSTDARTGVVSYRPDRGFIGSDTFEFAAVDAAGAVATSVPARVEVRFGCSSASQAFRGSILADVTFGCGGADVLRGGAGDDRLSGGPGRDQLFGDAGADTLRGDGGADQLAGGAGDDALSGGFGNDLLIGGAGRDYLGGGAGNDVIQARDRKVDVIDCGLGVDRVVADPRDIVRNCEYRP